jgi:hypothetical protein
MKRGEWVFTLSRRGRVKGNDNGKHTLAVVKSTRAWPLWLSWHEVPSVLAAPALPNDEAQTPRWGCPNSMVFSYTLRVIGVVCSAWFGCFPPNHDSDGSTG